MRKFGLIGFPLEHSFSKSYFFESYNGVYLTLNVNIFFFDSDIGTRGLTQAITWLLKLVQSNIDQTRLR